MKHVWLACFRVRLSAGGRPASGCRAVTAQEIAQRTADRKPASAWRHGHREMSCRCPHGGVSGWHAARTRKGQREMWGGLEPRLPTGSRAGRTRLRPFGIPDMRRRVALDIRMPIHREPVGGSPSWGQFFAHSTSRATSTPGGAARRGPCAGLRWVAVRRSDAGPCRMYFLLSAVIRGLAAGVGSAGESLVRRWCAGGFPWRPAWRPCRAGWG